jgi:hypothetical protein
VDTVPVKERFCFWRGAKGGVGMRIASRSGRARDEFPVEGVQRIGLSLREDAWAQSEEPKGSWGHFIAASTSCTASLPYALKRFP